MYTPKSFIFYICLLLMLSSIHLICYKLKNISILNSLHLRLKPIWTAALLISPTMWYPHLFGPLLLTAILFLSWLEFATKIKVSNILKWLPVLNLPTQWLVATEFIYSLNYSKIWTLAIPLIFLLSINLFYEKIWLKNYIRGVLFILLLPSLGLSLFERYPGWPLSLAIIVILIAQWSDAWQFLIGKFFGKTKFSKWSPNKTVEGLLGGWFVTLITTVVPIALWRNEWLITTSFVFNTIVFAYFGGLWSSYEKRQIEIKDWSSMLGTNGGILDRIDSILLSLPATYFFIALLKVIN